MWGICDSFFRNLYHTCRDDFVMEVLHCHALCETDFAATLESEKPVGMIRFIPFYCVFRARDSMIQLFSARGSLLAESGSVLSASAELSV